MEIINKYQIEVIRIMIYDDIASIIIDFVGFPNIEIFDEYYTKAVHSVYKTIINKISVNIEIYLYGNIANYSILRAVFDERGHQLFRLVLFGDNALITYVNEVNNHYIFSSILKDADFGSSSNGLERLYKTHLWTDTFTNIFWTFN